MIASIVGSFSGGSAWAMAREIASGYVLVSERTFRNMLAAQLDRLGFELNRLLRDLRGDQPPLDDISALRERNRRIQRVNSALSVLRAFRQKRKV